jgi:hypothetical protein
MTTETTAKPKTTRAHKAPVKPSMDLQRMSPWLLWTLVIMGFVAWNQPQQLEVVLYKAGLVTGAAWLGYWIDRSLFTRFRVEEKNEDLAVSMIRRAIVVGCVVIGMTLGL